MSSVMRFVSNAKTVPLWLHIFLAGAISIVFYVYLRSFPLITDDGAFNYMSLLQRLNSEHPFSFLFGFKLIEGLGQPNPFLTIAFDPFSWPMLLVRFGHETPENYVVAFRLTMALRMIVCWLGTYLLAQAAFPASRTVAITTSYLNVFLSAFLTTNFGATENHASMYNATQAALLPLVAGIYIRGIDLGKPLVSVNGMTVFILLFFLILSYPIGSLMAIAVLVGVGATIPVVGGAAIRRSASVHLGGLLAAIGAILFLPGLAVYASWQDVARVSSRVVFADELVPYFNGYLPPTYWYAPPIASRLIALCAVAGLLVIDRVPPLARSLMVSFVLMVGGIQLVGLASTLPVLADSFRSLPPIGRVETFFPPLYAFSAAIALYGAERALLANGGWRFPLWCAAAIVLCASAIYMFAGAYGRMAGAHIARSRASDLIVVLVVTPVALAFVFNALRFLAPRIVPASLRRAAGPIDAGAGLARLAHDAVSYAFVAVVIVYAARVWANQPYFIAGHFAGYFLCDRVTVFGCRDTDIGRGVNAGSNPVVDFLRGHLTSPGLFAGRAEYLSPYDLGRPDLFTMIGERTENFSDGGNGMLLASLSFNGIPVASTYEQSHDYLYFLFWTRYLMRDTHIRFSPNWTVLHQFLPAPLALAGVRYVVARENNRQALGATPIVFRWKDYLVAELEGANIRGYGVSHVLTAATIAEELSIMRGADFDPRREAVLSDVDRRLLPAGELQPVESSEITTRRQGLRLTARSAGKASLIVLPFRFSHCWTARWNGPPGTLVRADTALLAVYFEGAVDASLEWTGGYGALSRCLMADAALIEEARAAAKRFPY